MSNPTFIWLRRADARIRFEAYPTYSPRMIQWLRNGNREYC
jgi:hypothetical protein